LSLFRSAAELPVGIVDMGTSTFTTTLVHGSAASLMVAERPVGYHSGPHRHDCEQLNLLQAGELHVYCDALAYLLRPGDVLRIPAGAVHWSWNRADEPCVLVEVHAPGLQGDPEIAPIAVGLFDDAEDRVQVGTAVNVDVTLPVELVRRVEAQRPHVAA
jgi:mannose-6-phosphate isomerase-like protein (cupin superfamily)